MRGQFNHWLQNLAHELKTSPEHRRTGERFKRQLLENDELQDYLYKLWLDLSGRLQADLDSDDSKTRAEIAGWLQRVAAELENDADMQDWMNEWLVDTTVAVVDRNRAQIAIIASIPPISLPFKSSTYSRSSTCRRVKP